MQTGKVRSDQEIADFVGRKFCLPGWWPVTVTSSTVLQKSSPSTSVHLQPLEDPQLCLGVDARTSASHRVTEGKVAAELTHGWKYR
jgi:hypothetical protein